MDNKHRLVLMSYWRPAAEWFISYMHKNNVKKIAYIINAGKHRLIENPNFIFNDLEAIKDAGFEADAIDLDEIKDLEGRFLKVDLIYVRGGNTFELLNSVRNSNFDKLLPMLLEKGIIYASSSAGSIIPGPSIEIAENDFAPDYNKVGLVDKNGLNIVDFAVFPHWQEAWRKELDKLILEKNITYEIQTLKDNQVMIVENGTEKLLDL